MNAHEECRVKETNFGQRLGTTWELEGRRNDFKAKTHKSQKKKPGRMVSPLARGQNVEVLWIMDLSRNKHDLMLIGTCSRLIAFKCYQRKF